MGGVGYMLGGVGYILGGVHVGRVREDEGGQRYTLGGLGSQ